MDNNDSAAEISSNSLHLELRQQEHKEEEPLPVEEDQSLYLVPFRWWKEAQDPSSSEAKRGIPYAASPAPYGGPMKIFNNIFSSDIAFNLRKDDELSSNGENSEAGVSGKDYALVPGDMWLQTLKWHSDSKNSAKEGKGFSVVEEDMSDVYPLQLRLSVLCETNVLSVKISKKDNSVECFRRACKVFNMESEPLRVWDFSGQTMLLLLNDKNKILKEFQKPMEQDLLLELQVYGLSESFRNKGTRKDDSGKCSNGTLNGGSMNYFSNSARSSSKLLGNSSEAGTLGLTGLQNLGNTCFMNSALQCLAHTPKLVDYFLGDYKREINPENPLGMKGEIASSFGDLMKKLWAPGATPLAPRTFKLKLAHFAPQFGGFNQHDSQELLAFLLDGLHEDLNRVKFKPYVEAKDSDDRPDEQVADEYWKNHLARNDSIIVDVCQGQYRSTLVCPVCRKVSVTFDPFMYLSLPLPSTSMRTMTLTVVKADGTDKPLPFTVNVPKNGKLEDLTRALKTACSLGADETLLVAEIYNNRIIHFLKDPNGSLSLIRDNDQLVAYRIPDKEAPLFVFMHQQAEDKLINGKSMRLFGVPLVVNHNITNGYEVREVYTKILAPFLEPLEDFIGNSEDSDKGANESLIELDNAGISPLTAEKEEPDSHSETEFHFYLTNEKVTEKGSEIGMEELVKPTPLPEIQYVIVSWSQKMVKQYNIQPLSLLPEVFKSAFFTKHLPSTSMRTMTLSVVKADGTNKPLPITVNVPKNGKLEDLTRALKTACSLGADETLLVAEIYNNVIIHFLKDPNGSLSLIRDNDQLVAYRLPDTEAPLFVFMHQQAEDILINGKSMRLFGVPLVVRHNFTNGYEVREVYTKILTPFLELKDKGANEPLIELDNTGISPLTAEKEEPDSHSEKEFHFYLTNEKVTEKGSEIGMEELVKPTPVREIHYVIVSWSQKMVKQYNIQPLSLLPEVFKSAFFTKKPQESVSLYKCLEAFLKEEPLGPDDMWFCPKCKNHCQAGKKLDLWRLPEILVIHLKRFSYNCYLKNKLETFVDFPIHDLDLSTYIAQKGGQSSYRYMLYAISNHYGSMGGGHYTAFVHHGGDRWYDFDDSHVSPISEDKVKTSAAYVLFYRRVEDV